VLCVLALLKVIVVIAMERTGASPGHRPLYGLTSDFELKWTETSEGFFSSRLNGRWGKLGFFTFDNGDLQVDLRNGRC
jgi:hypothetical protein